MRKGRSLKRFCAVLLAGAVLLGGVPQSRKISAAGNNTGELVEKLPTLTVDLGEKTGDILHGASGFLYGISNEDVPTTNTLVPLKPKVLATKGALGTEHPYGDALDVAETFLASGGEQVMMYNSNYYGVFGVTANYKDYAKVLKDTIAPHVYEWKKEWKDKHGTPENAKDELGKIDIDKAIIYIPINEGTPVNGANTNIAWKAYYDAIKEGDPDATLAGPNSCAYNLQFVGTDMKGHMQYCADNNCMPDIVTWHELETDKLNSMSSHMTDFKKIWEGLDWTNWLKTHDGKLEMPQVVINEYAAMADCGVPGALVNWIARLEDEKIYGCLPFWQQANNLNGLTADANEGASAWHVYKWYGDMSGKTVDVKTSTKYNKLYGVASIDENKKMSTVLMGGSDGIQRLLVKNIHETETFAKADKVHVNVQKAEYNGYAGTVNETQTILDGAYPVSDDGNVEVLIPNATYADAYNVTITTAAETEQIEEPEIRSYSQTYEAENAEFGNLTTKSTGDYMPTYYLSNGKSVLMTKENDSITYEIDIPRDGNYNLNFLYGNGTGSNRNSMNTHKPKNVKQKYTIDGQEMSPVIMKNTLFTAITDSYCINQDFKAGKHSITIKNMESSDLIHDALRVTYEGKEGTGKDRAVRIYEAELADFNTLADNKTTTVTTQTEISGFSGNGYVTGLEKGAEVTDGGGIRFTTMAEESGIYNLTLRYQSANAGKVNIYIGNTVTKLDSFCTFVNVADSNGSWTDVKASVYLQKGINIIDLDADIGLMLDYMKVSEVFDQELGNDTIQKIEAENCIPEGASIETKNSEGASAGKYVVGMKGDTGASGDKNKYLEFEYNASEEGMYALRLFQSNDDICGSHTYNIKIIDKYASVQVKNEAGQITSANRYFFINTASDDTFKEKTVYLNLEKGKNKIRIFNDDSWHVKWGGTQATPGTNELENYLPNFDCFVMTKAVLENPVSITENEENENVTFGTIDVEEYFENQDPTTNDLKTDTALAYFVDCGDHDPTTLSGNDMLGKNNSVTDKIYGEDAKTGYKWGVITSENDKDEPQFDDGVYTTYQWAHERDVNDGLNKTASFRYAHNQLENGIAPRYVKYSFELEAGEYEVEVCMGNMWGNSANPDIHVDGKKINTGSLSVPQGGNKVVTGKLTVSKRTEVEVAAYSSDPTINMNYIKIKYVKDDNSEQTSNTKDPNAVSEQTSDTKDPNAVSEQTSNIKDPNAAKVSKVSIKIPNRKQGKSVYMKKGDKTALKTVVTGTGNFDKSVTWKSSKKAVVSVSSKGKVVAKKAGTATITAISKTDKNKYAKITIKVSRGAKKNKALKISPTKKSLKKGKSLTIKIKKMTRKTTDKIAYKSSNKSVATVDAYGKVKAKKKGKATITVKCGKKRVKLKLTVKK